MTTHDIRLLKNDYWIVDLSVDRTVGIEAAKRYLHSPKRIMTVKLLRQREKIFFVFGLAYGLALSVLWLNIIH